MMGTIRATLLTAKLTLLLWNLAENSDATRLTLKGTQTCATLSCFFNAMCVEDPDTGEAYCHCPTDECDSAQYSPICSEGITFKSPCHFHMHKCKLQRKIEGPHLGVCDDTDCGPTVPCPFYGSCESGKCVCKHCDNSSTTAYDVDSVLEPSKPVCGSNGVRYESECLMKYESCSTKTKLTVNADRDCSGGPSDLIDYAQTEDHLRHWIRDIESKDKQKLTASEGISSRQTRGTEQTCQILEVLGCLSSNHPRTRYLGTYFIDSTLTEFDSPVYRMMNNVRAGQKSVFLSRFKSPKVYNGSWIIGSQVGSGRGWFGVYDPASDPRNISSTWYSTTGTRKRPWRMEPTITLHCIGEKQKRRYPLHECIDTAVPGRYELNTRNNTGDMPLFAMNVTDMWDRNLTSYQPGQRIKVKVQNYARIDRFDTIYLVMQNEVDECGVPHLKRGRKKYQSKCHSQMLSRNAQRMGNTKLHFTMPTRGCVTFYVLLKSPRDEVYYDFSSNEYVISRHLTKTICHRS